MSLGERGDVRVRVAALVLALIVGIAALAASASDPPVDGFDRKFTGRTLRFDYFRTGEDGRVVVSPDGWRLEGPWAGPRRVLVDPDDRGDERRRLVDVSGRTLYSEGSSSIFFEWTSTREALDGRARTFHESFRFPEPREPAFVVLETRNDAGAFEVVHRERLDPSDAAIDASRMARLGALRVLHRSGPAARRVDLLIVGDGYPAERAEAFFDDAGRMMRALFAVEPYASRRDAFNVRALHVPSDDEGIRDPRRGEWRRTAFGLSFDAFGSDRYVLTESNRALREAVARAPHDAIALIFPNRKYGGGGIYGLWATVSAGTSVAEYVFVHELGHSFAGLADEYYTSQVAYEDLGPPDVEPWAPNVTALLPGTTLEWADLVTEGTPLPTPWSKTAYDEASLAYQAERAKLVESGAGDAAMEELFERVRAATQPVLRGDPRHGTVGAFEGAAYRGTGLYRPSVDCIMFSRNADAFCPVCRRAIERTIDRYR